MFQETEKEWILEAINHLKHRKARPDFSRISLRMKRKHQLTFAQTKKLLDSLIESGIVVKAVYKNNTSYRDVSKWKRGRLGGQIMNSNKMLNRFIQAIRGTELKGTGVSAKEIQDWLGSQSEEKCFLSGDALRDALENEVSNGYLHKILMGNIIFYSINEENVRNISLVSDEESPPETETPNSVLSSLIMAICDIEQSEGAGAALDDIENWPGWKKQSNDFFELNSLQSIVDTEVKKGVLIRKINPQGEGKILYAVNDKALETDHSAINTVEMHQRCTVVNCSADSNDSSKSRNQDALITESVVKGKSTTADINPVVPLRPPSKRKRVLKSHGPDFEMELPSKMKSRMCSENKDSTFPTPLDSPVSEKSECNLDQSFKSESKTQVKRGRPKKTLSRTQSEQSFLDQEEESWKNGGPSEQSSVYNEEDEDSCSTKSFPDCSGWTSQQVAEYFRDKGYVDEAEQMLLNDLDGTSLGLLRRSDIVGPPIGGFLKVKKLGIALKLFRDIRDLLYGGNSENYVDPYEERAFYHS